MYVEWHRALWSDRSGRGIELCRRRTYAATLCRVINLQIGSLADDWPWAMDAPVAISKNTNAIAAQVSVEAKNVDHFKR